MENKVNYYDINNLLKYHGEYYLIYGQRSNGKSYSATRKCIDDFFSHGHEFMIIKRYADDVRATNIQGILKDHIEYIREEYAHDVKYYRGKFYVKPCEIADKLENYDEFCYTASLSNCERMKGNQYPKVRTIIFEEFMSMNSTYLTNEINLLLNLVSTVFRNRQGCKIIMLANAIARVNPYSQALGIRFDKLEHDQIVSKEFKDPKGYRTTFIINRCKNVDVFDTVDNEYKRHYSTFGNSHLGRMINSGEFETGVFNDVFLNVAFKESVRNKTSEYGYYYIMEDEGFKTPIYVVYGSYVYETWLYHGLNSIVGFRECDTIDNSCVCVLVNSDMFLPNSMNVLNADIIKINDNFYLTMLMDIIKLVIENKFIIEGTNEDGQNVIDAFINVGVDDLKNR